MEILQWSEPRDFRRKRFYQSEKANPWAAIKTAAMSFVVLIGLRLVVEIGPKREGQNPPGWPMTFAMAVPVSLLVAYGIPLFISFLSLSRVIFSEKGVNNNIIGKGGVIYFWPWDSIGMLQLKTAKLDQKEYQTLIILDLNGAELAELCLADPGQVQGIKSWAEAKDIPLENSLS